MKPGSRKKSFRQSLFFCKPICFFFLPAIIFPLFVSCAHAPKEVGMWRGTGQTSTLEFKKGGSFSAVDTMGMAVSGNYFFDDKGNARLEIIHPGTYPEIITVKIVIQGDELTIEFADTVEVEKYRRER